MANPVTMERAVSAYSSKNFTRAIQLSSDLLKNNKDLNENNKMVLHYILAHSFYQTKNYPAAITYFDLTLQSAPFKYEILNNIGSCYFYLGQYSMARDFFKRSLKDNPGFELAQKNLEILNNAINRELEIKQDPATELIDLNYLPLFSLSSGVLNDINLAWLYFYLGKNNEAIYLLKKAIEADQSYPFSYLSLGYIYDSANNYKSAIKYYEMAKNLDNEYPDLWNNLGVTYYYTGEIEKAKEHFLHSIELNPEFSYPKNNLGFIYLGQKEYKTAIKYFNQVITTEYTDPLIIAESCAGVALSEFYLGNKERALAFKEKSLTLNPSMDNFNYLKKWLRWDNSQIEIYLEKIR